MTEQLRWTIAHLSDRVPGQCWADLATWALYWPEHGVTPWKPQRPSCRDDADQVGCCYCGKLQAEPWAATVHDTHRPDPDPGDWRTAHCACGWTGQDIRVHIAEQLAEARVSS